MELTSDLKDMEKGKYGEGAALALKVQIGIGECFDAPRMVPITNAHVALSNQEMDLWFAEKMVKLGAKTKIPPTVNPGFCLPYFSAKNMVTSEEADHMKRTHEAYRALGCRLTYNCTPYMDTNVPFPNEIVAFSESSATPFVNSVWGARSNRESAQSALCAAITGVVPEYGLLLDENRKGNILVKVEAEMKSDFSYNLLGYMGRKIGPGIPVFVGLGSYLSPEAHRNLGAELNTSGAYAMYHVVGVTPEAPTLEAAFGGREPERTVTITEEDLARVLETEISDPGNRDIDFALFGCPHTSIREVRYMAERLQGKKLAVPFWVMTSSLTKSSAEKMGLLKIIQDAGGDLVEDTCSDQPCWHLYKGRVGVTESPKCAYYPRKRGLEFVIRDLDTCIDAALKGRVK
ncbi:MAG: aconitase X catalytic domain-containing protein [Synergistaceae bacterium]|jgi:predicted aconitase|nr:aconitase X catalytic domain-containing protein [Synergistaceae bacterium]